jgi:hypothetical protein
MTASDQAKDVGFKSLVEVSRALGHNKNGHPLVSRQTLINWHRDKPALFDVVLKGVKVKTGLYTAPLSTG